jgi:hypothetical protein
MNKSNKSKTYFLVIGTIFERNFMEMLTFNYSKITTNNDAIFYILTNQNVYFLKKLGVIFEN